MHLRLFFVILLCVYPVAYAEDSTASYPKVFFQYSSLFEDFCPGGPVPKRFAEEAEREVPRFAKLWEDEAPALFGKVLEYFGRGFKRKELTATLSVCKNRSISTPLILSVRSYMKSAMGERVFSDRRFVHLVFHELLHTWVVDNVAFPTPLTQKYKNETQVVRYHLHLMAIQKLVYTLLGRTEMLELLNLYDTTPARDYKRAWQIVNQIEGYEAVIRDIPRQESVAAR